MGRRDISARDMARAELQRGERLLWASRPSPVALAASRRGYLWGGLIFFWFSVLWEAGVLCTADTDSKPLFLLWGIPFIFVGAGLTLYAPVSLWLAHRMVYAVTDRRLLILHHVPRRCVESFWPADIHMLAVTERANGRGDIRFWECVVRADDDGKVTRDQGFFGIAHVRMVARIAGRLRGSTADMPIPASALAPVELPDRMTSLLAPQEVVLWAGCQGRTSDLPGKIFGLAMLVLFVAIAAHGPLNVAISRHLSFSLESLTPFILIGLVGYGVVAQMLPILGLGRDAYAVTDRRLIVVPRQPFGEPRSIPLPDITGIRRFEHWDGTGDIRFWHREANRDGFCKDGLFGIADARDVEALLARRP